MSKGTGWIILKTKIQGQWVDVPYNTNFILYADSWMLNDSTECPDSIRVWFSNHDAPMRVQMTKKELSKNGDFLMIHSILGLNNEEKPVDGYQEKEVVICKRSIKYFRPYKEEGKNEYDKFIVYVVHQNPALINKFIVSDPMWHVLPEAVM